MKKLNLIHKNQSEIGYVIHNFPDGRFVIRPDSGDPVDIICGTSKKTWTRDTKYIPIQKGTYELLWDIFGGTINEKGYKMLNPKIGIIYGDSINLNRQKEIYKRLEDKGFAANNVVLGIGSFTYQFKSRDSLGFAVKSTWCQINNDGIEIFKDPKTDSGIKKSLKGLIKVQDLKAIDGINKEEENTGELITVFKNGELLTEYSLSYIRERVKQSL